MKTKVNKMKSGRYLLLAVIIAAMIFAADLIIPLGVAFGVPYIIVILITLQTPYRHAVIIAAVISTGLVLLGLVISPEGGEAWKVYFNRTIAIVAIWIVALLVSLIKKDKETLLRQSETELKTAQHIAKLGILRINFLDSSFWWSNELYRCFGNMKGEFKATYDKFFKCIHMNDVVRVREAIDKFRQSESVETMEIEYRTVTRNGDEFHIHTVFTPEKESNGQTLRCMGVCQDITERKKTEEELYKLSRAVEFSSSSIYITDLDGNIEYVNPKFSEITGYSREEATGNNPSFLKSGETPDTVYAELWKTISSGGQWKGEFHNRNKDGSLYWARNSISGVKNNKGEITHYVAIQEDLTNEYELLEQLSYQANHDALTGLVNRGEFELRTERLLSAVSQHKGEHALCFMDLDQFKVVNDTCGHAAGDELLRQITSVLQNVVRKRDTLARLGGDEFGVLIEHCSLDDAHRVATTLLTTTQNYQFLWEGHTFKVGVSIGLVPITETTSSLTKLLKDADAACYMAKDKGRNRIHVYHTEDAEMAQQHGEMQWVVRLNHALEEDRFCLYAQSIVSLDGSTDKHYELLVRMIDEKGETIPPGAFLPAAERYNLISKLDRWVIDKSFGLLADNPVFLKQIDFCSINLSGQSLDEVDFQEFVVNKISNTKIPPRKICFEITETATITNMNTTIPFISKLKALGCQFALDDFGSSLSSFAYLKNLPVDYIKIDGMFVKDIVDGQIDHAMVKSINEIGQVMGMQTIAECVENDVVKGMLKEIGVNYAQGYGIGKPRPFGDFIGRSNNITDIKDAREKKDNHDILSI